MEEKKYLAYLHSIGFTHRKLHRIFREKRNYQQVYETLSIKNLASLNFNQKQQDSIWKNYQSIDCQKIDQKIEKLDIRITDISESTYPKQLKEISNPPYMLYIRGKPTDMPCLSVIGSRSISTYGKRIIAKMLSELSQHFVIVSGGAYGCDSEAHRTCLKSGGTTYVIVGTGIDITYPLSNEKLYQEVIQGGGAIISIFPLGEIGKPHNFPIRNEIISGLSLGVLVVEAAEKSGTLITAKLALEQGRDVFSIPGEIDKSNSIGCNFLIKRGEAKLTTHPQDILEEYSFLKYKNTSSQKIQLNAFQENLCKELSVEPMHVDILVKKMQGDTSIVMREISLLEIKKILRKNTEGKYELV